MSPELLDQYLEVLERRGAASAQVNVGDGVSFIVNFKPEVPQMPAGDPVEPGGWKSPRKLDNPQDIEPLHLASDGEIP